MVTWLMKTIFDELKELQQPFQDGSNSIPLSEGNFTFSQAVGPELPGRVRGLGLHIRGIG